MGRVYSVSFAGVAISAVQDLIGIYNGANMATRLHGVVIGQITGTTVQNLKVSVHRLAATVTPGSSGTTATPQKMNRGDPSSVISSAHINDTTQATSAGNALLHADIYNTVNGFQFFWPPDTRPIAGLSEAFILSLDTAPTGGAMTMSGTLYFEELF